jgi:hypothetical protein
MSPRSLWDVVSVEQLHDWLDVRRELRRDERPDPAEYADLDREARGQ